MNDKDYYIGSREIRTYEILSRRLAVNSLTRLQTIPTQHPLNLIKPTLRSNRFYESIICENRMRLYFGIRIIYVL